MNPKLLIRIKTLSLSLSPLYRQHRCSHIAFLIKGNRIFKVGWNKLKTHPINAKHPYHVGTVGLHAEVDACLKSGLDSLEKFSLVVVRVNKNGSFSNSKPCTGCRSIISQFNIQNVWFTNQSGEFEQLFY